MVTLKSLSKCHSGRESFLVLDSLHGVGNKMAQVTPTARRHRRLRVPSFPVQTDAHFLAVVRYVERNAWRAQLVGRAEEWQWASLWRREQGTPTRLTLLSEWPVQRPRNWVARVNQPETAAELEVLRCRVQRGRPLGGWVERVAKRLGLESALRPRGRQKGRGCQP